MTPRAWAIWTLGRSWQHSCRGPLDIATILDYDKLSVSRFQGRRFSKFFHIILSMGSIDPWCMASLRNICVKLF